MSAGAHPGRRTHAHLGFPAPHRAMLCGPSHRSHWPGRGDVEETRKPLSPWALHCQPGGMGPPRLRASRTPPSREVSGPAVLKPVFPTDLLPNCSVSEGRSSSVTLGTPLSWMSHCSFQALRRIERTTHTMLARSAGWLFHGTSAVACPSRRDFGRCF